MTDRDPHLDDEELGGEIAAFLLGALEGEDVKAMKAHLEGCPTCQAEYQRLKPAAEALAMAVPQYRAPAAIGQRVMAAVLAESQGLRPARSRPRVRLWRRLWGNVGGLGGVAFAGAVAALLVVVLALGGAFSGGPGQQTFRAQVVGVHAASAVLHVRDGRAQLVVANMPQPALGRIYQVWLQRAGAAPQPTDALFGVSHSGGADVAVPGSLRGVQRVMVTSEPIGGSRAPTRTPLIVVSPV